MSAEVPLESEPLLTHVTLVIFGTRMNEGVVSKAVLQTKQFPTHFAFKFLHPSVGKGVCVEVAFLCKPFPAF